MPYSPCPKLRVIPKSLKKPSRTALSTMGAEPVTNLLSTAARAVGLRYTGTPENNQEILQAIRDCAALSKMSPKDIAQKAKRWDFISECMEVQIEEGRFTCLSRIVSDRYRANLEAVVDRMLAGDWSDALQQRTGQA